MGRDRRLMAAALGVVVLAAALTLTTASVDSANGRPGAAAGGSPSGAPTSPSTDPATGVPGAITVPCGRPMGCRSGGTRATTHSAPGASGPRLAGGPANPSTAVAGSSTPATQGPTTSASSTSATSGTATSRSGPTTVATSSPIGNGPARSTPSTWWRPAVAVAWQWELDHPLNLSSANDMGTGATTYLGAPAPDPTVYDIDGFDNSAATVSALHARGDHAVCYIEVGAAESYRPDYAQFPPADLGVAVSGYPSERYLDINDPAVVRIIEARIAMCASKGFDAVEPDIDGSYTESTGFGISLAQNVAYDTTLSRYAHGLGLGWALKNGDDPVFAASMQPAADFVVDEQCHQYSTCGSFSPFAAAGKAVLEVEYSEAPGRFCAAANAADQDSMAMDVSLSGGRRPCR